MFYLKDEQDCPIADFRSEKFRTKVALWKNKAVSLIFLYSIFSTVKTTLTLNVIRASRPHAIDYAATILRVTRLRADRFF